VYISYQLGLEQQSDTALFDATIHERADIISRETGDWWDFWYLDY
jgi:hypothetical protein